MLHRFFGKRRERAGGSRRRTLLPAAAAGLACWLVSGCVGENAAMPADKALALSASALSGSDTYGFNGEISVFDPNGMMADTSRFTGEVTGHGKMKINWTDESGRLQARETGKPSDVHPLQLLKSIGDRTARVAYAQQPGRNGGVQLSVTLDEAAAKRRIEESLRAQMKALENLANDRKLDAEGRKQAAALLSQASGKLNAALATLTVHTECLWAADARTWFPSRMTEQTELAYEWEGKPYREKRVSVTNFLPAGRNGTMVKNSSSNP